MGSYLNPGSKGFQESLNSEIYVDKSGLIEKTNAVINTRQKFICVSRPRRFGKSMAADMLAAYYDRGENSASLFDSLKISKAASYQQHLNQYDVIKVNMQEFLSMTHSMDEMLTMLPLPCFSIHGSAARQPHRVGNSERRISFSICSG